MILPANIGEISTLEEDLKACGFDPNDYLPVTMQLKCMLYERQNDPLKYNDMLMHAEVKKIFELIKNGSL